MKLRKMYKNMPKVANDEPDPLESMIIAEIDEDDEELRNSSPSGSIKSMTDLNWPREAEGILTEADYEDQLSISGGEEGDNALKSSVAPKTQISTQIDFNKSIEQGSQATQVT